jgi:acetyl esterase/lipase
MILISKTYWGGAPFQFRRAPNGAHLESLVIRADDFRQSRALYWTPGGNPRPKVAAICMHPRVDFTHHYSIPRLVAAGIGVLGANTRHPNNDIDTVHEDIVLDLAACVKFLKQRRGVDRVILFGNSGGGALAALFQAQARLAPGERIAATPGGEPTKLGMAEMIPADGLVLVACHRGQGKVLEQCIDPAVVDEADPLATDASLDMYDPANGFRPPPEWTTYSDEFVAGYRAAQLDRVRRLDDRAREHIAAQHGGGSREEALERVMVVYRTMANLNYVDRHLDPSGRDYGSLLSERPDLMNLQLLGFSRVVTPRAWLSTWSGISSNADLVSNLAGITEPIFVAHAGRDREIYPATDAAPIAAAVVSKDKTIREFSGARHYFEPDFGSTDTAHVDALMDAVVPWIQERFGD